MAASSPGDAKICEALAETVYASLQAQKDVKQMGRLNDALIKKREEIAKQADWELRHADTPSLSSANTKQGLKEAEKKKAKASKLGSLHYQGMVQQIAEIESVRKKQTIQGEKQILQTKIQFQATMMQWLMQRRFHHVIIGARFYNVLWQDGDNALYAQKDSSFSKMFTALYGVQPYRDGTGLYLK